MEDYDAIVVGAGTAGCLAAKTISAAGLSVCIVDRKVKGEIGNKVCGDAIGRHHFDHLSLAYPKGKELEQEILGIKVYSPDKETVFRVRDESIHGFMVNRHLFGQRLLKDALDSGAILKDSTQAIKPIIKDGAVKGVLAEDLRTGKRTELKANATVEASGVSSVLRNNLPPEFGIETEISKEDFIVCYREIRELKGEIAEPTFCDIYLDLKVAPGGYCWIFPETKRRVNVGLGVVATEGSVNPKKQLYEHILSKPLFEGSSIIHGGGGIVPTRRPISSMVGNGIAIIGDAACHVNPIHGGGMGPSMIAGRIAGETLVRAIEHEDVSIPALWSLNTRYMSLYGAKQAGLDVFRIFLQGLSNSDIDYGMRYQLISEEDLLKTSLGEDIHLNVTDATRRVFRGLGRVSFLKKLYRMAELSKEAKNLYREYPASPDGLAQWNLKTQRLIKKTKNLFLNH